MTKASITSSQEEKLIQILQDAAKKASPIAVKRFMQGNPTREAAQQAIESADKLQKSVIDYLVTLLQQAGSIMPRLISEGKEVVIGACDGKETLAEAKDLFPGYLDSGLKNYGTDVPGEPTKDVPVQVYELIKDGTFENIFGSMPAELDRLCLTQAQIISFVKNHRDWLRTDGWVTFFLFKVGTNFFVALVGVSGDGQLGVRAGRLSDDYVWYAEHRFRFVVPQLTTQVPCS